MYTINPGEFKHKIEIQKATITKVNFRPSEGWTTILATRAKTMAKSYNDNKIITKDSAHGGVDEITKRLMIRTPRNLELTNDYRVLYRGYYYRIKSSNDINDLGVYTELIIERVE